MIARHRREQVLSTQSGQRSAQNADAQALGRARNIVVCGTYEAQSSAGKNVGSWSRRLSESELLVELERRLLEVRTDIGLNAKSYSS